MRGIFYIGLIVSLYSCSERMFTYKFSMNESIKPNRQYYENDTLSFSFDFYPTGIMIDFTNKSKELIKINWEELRITENEKEKKIEHILIREWGLYVFKPTSIIEPKSNCTDFVVYAENIFYIKEDGKEVMKLKDMYPLKGNKSTRDSVLNLINQRIALFFPVDIKNVSYTKNFNFLVKKVRSRNTAWELTGLIPVPSF